MSKTMSEEKHITYRTIDQPLNVAHTNKEIPIGAKIIYFLRTPIAIEMRLNKIGNDSFSANSIQIIKASKGQLITSIFITTLETDSSDMRLLITDIDIFSDIGIQDRVVLLDTLGVEYDSRLRKSSQVTLFNAAITTIETASGSVIDFSSYEKGAFTLINGSDVELSIQFQGKNLLTEWYDIGSAIVLSASGGKDVATITDAWKDIRVQVTNTDLGTSGFCTVYGNLK